MKMTARRILMAAAAGAYLVGMASVAAAGNHLACYKGKDTTPGVLKIKYTANLESNTVLPNIAGCTISAPPKFCCDPVDKTNISPTPTGGGGPVGAVTKFCCYKAKCPKPVVAPTISALDQFGNHTQFTTKGVKLVCAPASPSGAFLDDARF